MRLSREVVVLIVLMFFGVGGVLAADTASITSKSDDGAYLALDDGTKWIVSDSDMGTVSTWSVGDDVVYIDNSKNCTHTEVINTDDDGDAVCVEPVTN
jgi:hypothetical protein